MTEMNEISILCKLDLAEVDLTINILSNLPEEYEVVVSKLGDNLRYTINP